MDLQLKEELGMETLHTLRNRPRTRAQCMPELTFIQIYSGQAKNPDLLNLPIKHFLFHRASFHELGFFTCLRMLMIFLLLVCYIFSSCLNLYVTSEFPSANLIMIQTIHFNEITLGWFPRLGLRRLEQIIGSSGYFF